MELKTFIKQSLIDISTAIKEANEDKTTDMIVNPNKIVCAGSADQRITKENYNNEKGIRYVQNIKFDVAVTVGNNSTEGMEKNINIAEVNVNQTSGSKDEQSTASRIQFELLVALPHGEY